MPSTEPNRIWKIHSVTPKEIEGTENGEPLTLTPDLGVLDSPRARDSNPMSLSFPLEVGKRWGYTTDWVFKAKGSKGGAAVQVEVVAYERLKIPAGEFDAFKLVAKSEINANPKDKADHPNGVWALPPVLANKDAKRADYLAVGESDRMTLKFVK